MNAYMYRAALYCQSCGESLCDSIPPPVAIDRQNESTWDSDEYPKGPYADGGGEADTPNHCDACDVFLANPLTRDGVRYVIDAIGDLEHLGRGNAAVIETWREFYKTEIYDYDPTPD